MLTLSKGYDGFVVHIGASRVGLGCVHKRNGKFTAYSLRKNKINKKTYLTHDLELVTTIFPLQIWMRYLYGVHVDEFTDQNKIELRCMGK